jgi:hypothetical protein
VFQGMVIPKTVTLDVVVPVILVLGLPEEGSMIGLLGEKCIEDLLRENILKGNPDRPPGRGLNPLHPLGRAIAGTAGIHVRVKTVDLGGIGREGGVTPPLTILLRPIVANLLIGNEGDHLLTNSYNFSLKCRRSLMNKCLFLPKF